jgi:hypothetical protein
MSVLKYRTQELNVKHLILPNEDNKHIVFPYILFYRFNYISTKEFLNLQKKCLEQYNLVCELLPKNKAKAVHFSDTLYQSLLSGIIVIVYPKHMKVLLSESPMDLSYLFNQTRSNMENSTDLNLINSNIIAEYPEVIFLFARWKKYIIVDLTLLKPVSNTFRGLSNTLLSNSTLVSTQVSTTLFTFLNSCLFMVTSNAKKAYESN